MRSRPVLMENQWLQPAKCWENNTDIVWTKMIYSDGLEENFVWLNRINPQLNIVWQGGWPCGNVEAARRIYDHELVLFTQGECQVQVENRDYRCGPGTFMIIPP